MNAIQAIKRAEKAAYCLQQLVFIHTGKPVQQGQLWDSIRKACGVSEQAIMCRKGYKYAENSARAQLAEQMQSSKGGVSGAEDLNSDMAGDETMTNNMTSFRSWKFDNAGVIQEREDIKEEEQSKMKN